MGKQFSEPVTIDSIGLWQLGMKLETKEKGKTSVITKRVGKVSITTTNFDSLRIRFTYPKGDRQQLALGKADDATWEKAIRIAAMINRDIDFGDVDLTFARYLPSKKKIEPRASNENKTPKLNLKQLWDDYKAIKYHQVQKTTIKKDWSRIDRVLERVSQENIDLDRAKEFLSELLGIYTKCSAKNICRNLYAAVNLAVKEGKLSSNPYSKYFTPYSKNKSKIEVFSISEIKAILAAFYADEYNPKDSAFKHSHYAQYVEFLALTGCRPEEAIAITWDDVKRQKDRVFLRISKAHTDGILKDTKTHEIRVFPCNQQLIDLLESTPRRKTKYNLIFPAIKGGYINQGNFSQDVWRVVVNGLVNDGKVDKYLYPYCLRHSFITRLIREGIDIATVARLSGNSVQVICDHYLASKDTIEIPLM
jgi:integrase